MRGLAVREIWIDINNPQVRRLLETMPDLELVNGSPPVVMAPAQRGRRRRPFGRVIRQGR